MHPPGKNPSHPDNVEDLANPKWWKDLMQPLKYRQSDSQTPEQNLTDSLNLEMPRHHRRRPQLRFADEQEDQEKNEASGTQVVQNITRSGNSPNLRSFKHIQTVEEKGPRYERRAVTQMHRQLSFQDKVTGRYPMHDRKFGATQLLHATNEGTSDEISDGSTTSRRHRSSFEDRG